MPQPFVLSPPQIRLSDGALEALKYLALVLMTLDHANQFLLNESMPAFYVMGRLAFPLFAFILGWNLARPGLVESGAGNRILKRLFWYGLAATLPYAYLMDYAWWPLNILFTLWGGTAIVLLLMRQDDRFTLAAVFLFLISGAFVDYQWFGIAVCVSSFIFCRRPTWTNFAFWTGSLASLAIINHNLAALLAVPLLVLASSWTLHIPRLKHFFYWFYPAHLVLIVLLS
jgi:hypothetical protein